MKKYVFTGAVAVSAAMLAMPLAAHAETKIGSVDVSANVGFVTEYSFRGIAQSNEGPAVQGGFDLSHDSGLYAGIWGSSVEFNDASLETDLYAGYSHSIGNFSYDIGAIYYLYPETDRSQDLNFYEIAAAAGYDFDVASISASVNYSPDFLAGSGDAVYMNLAGNVPLPYDFSLNGHVGRQIIEQNAAFGTPDYTDWGLGVAYTWKGIDMNLSYIDTDLKEPSECADGCDAKVIFGISHSF
ncbi:MAG: TorF family putative porin [Alphaproteobacteria bacterium]|nr:TorF family putative porin [Alphaproteobacteria bacterium]